MMGLYPYEVQAPEKRTSRVHVCVLSNDTLYEFLVPGMRWILDRAGPRNLSPKHPIGAPNPVRGTETKKDGIAPVLEVPSP